MQEQSEIRIRMAAVRRRGLANANQLAQQVEKLSDWREHVRAHPLPVALAVAGLAFWAVPSRLHRGKRGALVSNPTPASSVSSVDQNSPDHATEQAAKRSGLAGAAMGFVGSLLGNAVRSYVTEQVQTLITPRGNHAASQQRPAPYARF